MSGSGKVTGVVGSFAHLDSLLEAIAAVRQAGWELEVFSPTPRHEIAHALAGRKSPVRYVTFSGALTGLTVAFLMTIGSSLIWNMIVGGKRVVSVVPFMVPAFELTILLGGIATLLAILHFSRVPSRHSAGYHPSFSDDRFGLFALVPADKFDQAQGLLKENHAERCWTVPGADGEGEGS
jgi:molybdopterin-containing oxidoreductase family membrane subunit